MDELYGTKWGFTRELGARVEMTAQLVETLTPAPLLPRCQVVVFASRTLPSNNLCTDVWPPCRSGLGLGLGRGFLSDALVYATAFHESCKSSRSRDRI